MISATPASKLCAVVPAVPPAEPAWHADFLKMLPAIEAYAQRAFLQQPRHARQDAVDEVVANALVAFVRLVERGKRESAYSTPLAAYAVKQVRQGRQVGNRLNAYDVLSRYAQQQHAIQVNRLHEFDDQENSWQEVLVEDKRATPADTAASRIDFADWLKTLPGRHRQIAQVLAMRETTSAAAKKFGVSSARISQIRRELQAAWQVFQGEIELAECAAYA